MNAEAAAVHPRYERGDMAGNAKVLVVGADLESVGVVRRALPATCALEVVSSAQEGVEALARDRFDLIVCDSQFGDLRNLEEVPLVIVSRDADVDEAALSSTLRRAVAGRGGGIAGESIVIGSSPAFVAALEAVDRVGASTAPVLLVGETGVGKDLLAARIHARGPRRHHPFVVVNAGAIQAALLDSELFGHAAGAFTGATRARRGLIAEAEKGTVFLDEITDLPLELQGRLLRVVETGNARAVGSDHERRVDVRFVAATQRPLAEAVAAGRFREDLLHRLAILSIHVPPLRERRDDITPLARYFFARTRVRNPNSPVRELGSAAEQALTAAPWPGNVRQLAAVIERAIVFGTTPRVAVSDLGLSGEQVSSQPWQWPSGKPCSLQALTSRYVEWVLSQTDGDKARAAAILEVDVSTLYRWQRRQSSDR